MAKDLEYFTFDCLNLSLDDIMDSAKSGSKAWTVQSRPQYLFK